MLKRNNDLASILLVDSFKEADLSSVDFMRYRLRFLVEYFMKMGCSKVNN